MTKFKTNAELLAAVQEQGDCTIDYINRVGKRRYAVVTADLLACPYTAEKTLEYAKKHTGTQLEICNEEGVLLFSWDGDKFMRVSALQITALTPLSAVLKNG